MQNLNTLEYPAAELDSKILQEHKEEIKQLQQHQKNFPDDLIIKKLLQIAHLRLQILKIVQNEKLTKR